MDGVAQSLLLICVKLFLFYFNHVGLELQAKPGASNKILLFMYVYLFNSAQDFLLTIVLYDKFHMYENE